MVSDRNRNMINLFHGGVPLPVICRRYGVGERTVADVVSGGTHSNTYTVANNSEIIDWYDEDESRLLIDVVDEFSIQPDVAIEMLGDLPRRSGAGRIGDNQERMASLYIEDKFTSLELSKLFGVAPSTVVRRLNKYGVEMRKPGYQRYLDFNDSFFENINTEAKAYWLGFMFADGYVLSNMKDVGVTLASSDRPHLEKFRKDIEYSGDIYDYEGGTGDYTYDYSRLRLRSEPMCGDLVSHGCVPQKTELGGEPVGVPGDLVRHFVRGVNDGDGGVYVYEKYASIETVGGAVLLSWIKNNATVELSSPRPHKNTIWRIRTSTSNVVEYARWLYEDANVYLDRKYGSAMKLLERFG